MYIKTYRIITGNAKPNAVVCLSRDVQRSLCCVLGLFVSFQFALLEIKSFQFHVAEEQIQCVRRPAEYSNKATSRARCFPSIRGSRIGPADVNRQRADCDDVGDDVSAHR